MTIENNEVISINYYWFSLDSIFYQLFLAILSDRSVHGGEEDLCQLDYVGYLLAKFTPGKWTLMMID
jgi:hypothetical protein